MKLTNLLLVSLALLAGCAENAFQVRDPARIQPQNLPLASEVLLEVDDAGVKWGSGKVGPALRAALLRNQTFGQVHHPIYPTYKVPFQLRVKAQGDIESGAGGMAKAFITGFLLFLPVGVIQYQDTFTIAAEVLVLRDGVPVGSFNVDAAVDVDHTLFATPESYSARVSELVLDELGSRISVALSRQPEWFSK